MHNYEFGLPDLERGNDEASTKQVQ